MMTSRATVRTIFIFVLAVVPAIHTSAAFAANPELNKVLKIQKELEETIASVLPAFVQVGGGSGVLISEDGYFLTNYHVAWQVFNHSETTTIMLPGGASYIARKVGWDPLGDVTLCKLELKDGETVPFLEFGDSDALKTGQIAIILGNPFSLSNNSKPTVSFGVVSAKNRYIGTGKLGVSFLYGDAIQTDAALNPGNSGGPMISLDGKLLGLNGLIFSRHGHKANTGIGYAVSINQIKLFMDLLKEKDVCYHGTINGIVYDLSFGKHSLGAHIKNVIKNSTAEKAGFKAGDVITSVNDTEISTASRFLWMLNKHPENTEFKITVKRGDKEAEINITTERIPWLNSKLKLPGQKKKKQPTSDSDRAVLGIVFDTQYNGMGAKIKQVIPNSGSEKAGILEGDVIVKVDDKAVANYQAMAALLKDKKAGDKVKMTVRRGEEEMVLDVEFMKLSDLKKTEPEKPEEEPEEQPEESPEESPQEP